MKNKPVIEGVNKINNNCFTINSSVLNNKEFILSAQYYDIDYQINQIILRLNDKKNIEELFNWLKKIINNKYILEDSFYNNRIILHPILIEHLKKILLSFNVKNFT